MVVLAAWHDHGETRTVGRQIPILLEHLRELVEAKHQLQLRRVMARCTRYDLIAIDEVGYVPLVEVGAEFLFQLVAERAESGGRPHHESAVLGMDAGDPERAPLQGASGPNPRPPLTFLRPARNRIVSAEPPRSRRKEPKQTNSGKPWK